MKQISSKSLLAGTVSALVLASMQGVALSPAMAQTTTGASAMLEEIVVTSRRRTETLQDVPIAVNVFSAATLERAGIDRPEDYLALTPNVHFIQTTNVGETQVHIRGVIQPRDTEPPFAYVMDGVLVPNPNAFNQELVDIQQIEVIKGPLGSIYGRNAIGGAILVTTQKPSNDFEGMVKAGYEVEGEEYNVSGYVSGPLVEDKLFARLTAAYVDREGYYENVTLNEKEDKFQEGLVRGRIVWKATENVEVDLNLGYGKVDGHAFNFNSQTMGTPGFVTGVDINDTSVPNAGNVRSFNNQERYDARMKIDWTTDFGTLTLSGAYHDLKEDMGGEGAVDLGLFGAYLDPGNPLFIDPGQFFGDPSLFEGYGPTPRDGTQYQQRNQDDKSLELRFTSPDDQRLRYIAGAYYIEFDREVVLNTGFDTGDGVVLRAPLSGVDSANPTNTLLWADNKNKAYALFGQLAYDVTEQLELSLALRWDREERRNINVVPDVPSPGSVILGAPIPLTNFPGVTRKDNFQDLQPRVSVRYRPSDAFTLYATYGEGFRSGGFNPLGSRNAIITVDGVTNTTVQDFFGKETSKSGEVGFKASFLDRRVNLNAAAFYTEVNDAHFFQFFPFSLSRVISIVDKNEIMGFEFDVTARVTEGLDLFGGFGLTDSEIKQNSELPETVGNTMPFTPKYNAIAGAQYVRPLVNDLNLVARLEYTRTGPLYFDTLNTPGTKRESIDLVNARLGLETDSWSATVWARNLFDKRYNADGVVLVVPNVTVFNFVTKAAPATWGIDVKYRF